MAVLPRFKIYNAHNKYVGCVKEASDAAALASVLGDGSTVRDGHKKSDIIWNEGSEVISAGESYIDAADIMQKRLSSGETE